MWTVDQGARWFRLTLCTAAPTRRGKLSGPAQQRRRPEHRAAPTADSGLIQLQTRAGNRAVAALLAATVQRQRKTAGWTGADTAGPGWNVGAKDDVEGSEVRRIPVDDVPVGNQKDFADETYVDKTGKRIAGRANEQAKTRESAAGRAIVLKPKLLSVDAPIDVLLHLHGYTSRAWDPYGGWRQSRKATTKGTDKDYRAVRDVDQDRIAQQIGAVKNPQILGILPQGVGHSQFNNLAPRTYVDAVLLRLEQINELPKPVSGHAPDQPRAVGPQRRRAHDQSRPPERAGGGQGQAHRDTRAGARRGGALRSDQRHR